MPVTVRIDVENTGSRAGATVVQAYVKMMADTRATAPNRQLAAFSRVELAAGERRTVTLEIAPHELGIVDDSGIRRVQPGQVAIAVGNAQPGADMQHTSDATGLAATFTSTGDPHDVRD